MSYTRKPASIAKQDRIALGLAVSALSMTYGDVRTAEDIAAFTGVTKRAVQIWERDAIANFKKHPDAAQLLRALFTR